MKQDNMEPTDAQYIERLEYCQRPMNCCICKYRGDCYLDNKKTVDLIHRQKAEIERLTKENERLSDLEFTQEHCDLYQENEYLKECLVLAKEQAVKDTAKKYHDAVKKMFDDADCCGWIEDSETKYWHDDNDKIAREQFSVEVE